jgi:hypothetical protein
MYQYAIRLALGFAAIIAAGLTVASLLALVESYAAYAGVVSAAIGVGLVGNRMPWLRPYALAWLVGAIGTVVFIAVLYVSHI